MNSYEVDGPKAGSSKKAGSNFILPAITVCGIIMAIILLGVFFTRPKGGAAEDSLITALETELLSSISNETSRALSAETSLYVSLQAESSRTIASEANISDSVALEQSRAQIVEASIAVTATNSQFPSGGIIMWSGSTASIPSGWHLCDGTSGTPDLQDRFVVGAGLSYGVGNTGGAATVALVVAELPPHGHEVLMNSAIGIAEIPPAGSSSPDGSWYAFADYPHDAPYHTGNPYGANSDCYAASTGSGAAHENRPPYYALAYIMKL